MTFDTSNKNLVSIHFCSSLGSLIKTLSFEDSHIIIGVFFNIKIAGKGALDKSSSEFGCKPLALKPRISKIAARVCNFIIDSLKVFDQL